MDDDLQLVRGSGVTQVQRRAAWARIVGNWRQSGLSATEFARRHGLREKALFRWQGKLRPQPSAAPVFDELRPPAASGAAALELCAGDMRVLVHNHCHADLLRNLVHLLRERSC